MILLLVLSTTVTIILIAVYLGEGGSCLSGWRRRPIASQQFSCLTEHTIMQTCITINTSRVYHDVRAKTTLFDNTTDSMIHNTSVSSLSDLSERGPAMSTIVGPVGR